MRPNEIVHRFLASIGPPRAAEAYLQLFQAERKERFALVVIHPEVLGASMSALIADLQLLQKLELTPVLCVESDAQREELMARLPRGFPARSSALPRCAEDAAGGRMPIIAAADQEEREAALRKLEPRKLVYLIARSGLQPNDEPVRSLINLCTDFDELSAPGRLPERQAELLQEIAGLFEGSEHTFTVAVTSAHDLVRELFTIKGAGTLVRQGTAVQRLESYEELDDPARFSKLLHSAFGRHPREDYRERKLISLYLAEGYRGAAVLEERELAPYLSKFAVDIRAQGEGIGGDLWKALSADHERFFWRSRPHNPISAWYDSKCEGLVRTPAWTVYWRGLAPEEIADAVACATEAPVDFERHE